MGDADFDGHKIYFLCQEGLDRSLCLKRAFQKYLELSDYQGPVVGTGSGSAYNEDLLKRINPEDIIVVHEIISDSDLVHIKKIIPYCENIIRASIPRGAVAIVQNFDVELDPTQKSELMRWGETLRAKIKLDQKPNRVALRSEPKSKVKN